jgi:hypothetical protein
VNKNEETIDKLKMDQSAKLIESVEAFRAILA